MIEIPLLKLNENAEIPDFKHANDAAVDLTAVSCEYDSERDRFIYGLGFATEIPVGYYVQILPRSGNTKTEAYIPNSAGIIDADYRGEWKVIYKLRTRRDILLPYGEDDDLAILEMANEMAPYKIGDKLAQALLIKKPEWKFVEVESLSETERGEDGGINRADIDFTK